MNTKLLWHKHHKLNDQRGSMPKHVYISHIMIYALPPFMAPAAHTLTTWQTFTSSGHVATSDNLMSDESSSDKEVRNGKEQWLVPEVYGIGKVMEQPLDVNITRKDMLSTRMNHRQTAIIKTWIPVVHDPEPRKAIGPDYLPEKVRHLLDMNPEQDAVPVLEHTNYSLKNCVKSRYHSDDNIMQILANHQLGNAVTELPTQENQPEGTKVDKPTESSVDKPAEWKKSDLQDWGSKSYRMPQPWGSNSWSSHTWQEKDSSDDKYKNNFYKKQKTSDSAQKEAIWRKRQAVCYTTHDRGILTVISSFPVDYFCTSKCNYVSPAAGDHCDPSTVYPIPSGDLLEYGKSRPDTLRGMKLPDDNTPYDDIPSVWKGYQKQQEHDHRRCTFAAIEDQQLTAERARAEHMARQNKFKEKDALKLTFNDKVGKADVIHHGDVELVEISEKKGDPSPSKSDPPISPAAK